MHNVSCATPDGVEHGLSTLALTKRGIPSAAVSITLSFDEANCLAEGISLLSWDEGEGDFFERLWSRLASAGAPGAGFYSEERDGDEPAVYREADDDGPLDEDTCESPESDRA